MESERFRRRGRLRATRSGDQSVNQASRRKAEGERTAKRIVPGVPVATKETPLATIEVEDELDDACQLILTT